MRMSVKRFGPIIVVFLCAFLIATEAEGPCGVSQICYRLPDNCYPPSQCTYFVAWSVNNGSNSDLIEFEISMAVEPGEQFAAIGISDNDKMTESDVYACRSDQTLQRYFTESYGNVPISVIKGLSNIIVDPVTDGNLHCTFTRNVKLDDGDATFIDLSVPRFLILATAATSGASLTQHSRSKRWFSEAFDFLDEDFTPISSDGGIDVVAGQKAHGSLMVIGWICFASIGIIIARYYRPMCPNSTLCGSKVWFNLHRIFMISAWVFFVIAIIIIFVVVKEFISTDNKTRFSHAVIGCISVGLGTINPIMAMFRPHPGTPHRPIFNILHRSVGITGWLLAVITTIIATSFYFNSDSVSEVSAFWVMIVFVVFVIVMVAILEIHQYITDKQEPSEGIAMQDINSEPKPSSNDVAEPPGTNVKKFLLALYIFGVVFITIYMVVSIATHDA